jgi:small subunit ribosomal protein S5
MTQVEEKIKVSQLEFEEKIVEVRRVVKVTKGGRDFSLSAFVVIGDGKGVIGYGLGNARQVPDAVRKAVNNARKKLFKVPIRRETIPHEAIGKFKGGTVFIKPAAPGTGIIAGAGVRIVLQIAGIHNILAKSKRSSNPQNVVKATFEALKKLRDPLMVARQRGISLEKVFNG